MSIFISGGTISLQSDSDLFLVTIRVNFEKKKYSNYPIRKAEARSPYMINCSRSAALVTLFSYGAVSVLLQKVAPFFLVSG